MQKHLVLLLAFILVSVSNLSAKTIWIFDDMEDKPSMVKFYNQVINDFKTCKYKNSMKIARNQKDIIPAKGDLLIDLSGLVISINNIDISSIIWNGCVFDNCNNWAYARRRTNSFTEDLINKYSRETSIGMLEFIEQFF
mgnify:CR=1 FL=1